MTPTTLILLATARGLALEPRGGGRPDWTASDAALFAKDVPPTAFEAFVYRYADFSGGRHHLWAELFIRAMDLKQRESWPDRVCGQKYIERLCNLVLDEERWLRPMQDPAHRAGYMQVSDTTWRRRLANPHGALYGIFDGWCQTAQLVIRRNLTRGGYLQ